MAQVPAQLGQSKPAVQQPVAGQAVTVNVGTPSISPTNPAGAKQTEAAKAAQVVRVIPASPAPAVAQQTTASPPPFRITTAGATASWMKMLIYGKFGSGKTRLGASAVEVPQMNDVFLLNCEGGDLTVRGAFEGVDDDRIDQVRVTTYSELARAQEYLKTHVQLRDTNNIEGLRKWESWLKGVPVDQIKEPKKYRTVVIDSLTEAEAFLMYQILGVQGNIRLDEETQSPEWAEYKKNNNMMQRMIRSFRDLPMHVIFICASAYVQDEQKRFNYGPQMTGKLSNQVQAFVDVVGYLDANATGDGKGISRVLWVQPVSRFAAKCRFSNYKLPYFVNPDLKGILQAVGLLRTPPGAQSVVEQQASLPTPVIPDAPTSAAQAPSTAQPATSDSAPAEKPAAS